MFNTQSKNTIKAVAAVVLTLILGEGVLGWGIYWPFLLILLDHPAIYWLAFATGIVVSVLRGIPVGLPSLFLLIVIGGLSITTSARTQRGGVMIIIAIVANFIFDKVFGLSWSLWEMFAIVVSGTLAMKWFEKGESIKLNY